MDLTEQDCLALGDLFNSKGYEIYKQLLARIKANSENGLYKSVGEEHFKFVGNMFIVDRILRLPQDVSGRFKALSRPRKG